MITLFSPRESFSAETHQYNCKNALKQQYDMKMLVIITFFITEKLRATAQFRAQNWNTLIFLNELVDSTFADKHPVSQIKSKGF